MRIQSDGKDGNLSITRLCYLWIASKLET